MMFYYYCGNLIFSLMFATIYAILIDRPIVSILNLETDLIFAKLNKEFAISKFMIDQNGLGASVTSATQVANQSDQYIQHHYSGDLSGER